MLWTKKEHRLISGLLQRLYIAILNPVFSRYISKMDEKVRITYLKFIFYCFQIYYILFFSNEFKKILFSYSQRELFGSLLLLLAAAFSMKEPLHPVRWKKRIFIPVLLCAVGLIVTGLMHSIGSGYMMFGVELLLIFPCFYFVWNNRKDYETLFDIAATSNMEIGSLYFLYCVTIFREDMFITNGERFQGSIKDPNLYSLIGMAMVCSALYMMYRRRRNKQYIVFCVTTIIMGMAIIVLGQSRSALMTAVGATLIVLIFTVKNRKGLKKELGMTTKAFAICMALLLCMSVVTKVVMAEGEEGPDASTDNGFIERFSPEGKDLNTFTSGRADIWANYAEKLNMTGNDFSKTDWAELTGNTVAHAHNNFLEYGYRCGIPVATMFVLLELFAGLITLKYLFSSKWNRDCFLYAIICMFMYTVMSMLDIATIPMERYAPFAFYILLTVLIDSNEKATSDK